MPQGLNLDTIGILRISNTAYVVRMHFNSDEETMTTANENANRYVLAGEATIHLTIGEEHATVQCEPDDASHLSVTHIVPMGKVTLPTWSFPGHEVVGHEASFPDSFFGTSVFSFPSAYGITGYE